MPQEITINDVKFTIALDPYQPGHTCTEGEARALTQTRAENLRNNFAQKMRKAAEEGKTLSQAEFDEYASEYEFGVRGVGTRLDPLESELRSMAIVALRTQCKAKNIAYNSLDDGVRDAAIEKILAAKREAWTPQAQATVNQKRAARNTAAADVEAVI